MSTYRAVASQLAYASTDSSSWTRGAAFQGAYGSGRPYVGALRFAGLRGDVAWDEMNVLAVRLWLRFGSAGGARRKTLGLYGAVREDFGGSGAAMARTLIGQARTTAAAWNASETLEFDENRNAAAFAGWKSWLEGGQGGIVALYLNESTAAGDSYSANYLIIENAGVEIDYEPRGSAGRIEPQSAEIGEQVTLTIEPIASAREVTHTARWSLGGTASAEIAIPGGVTESSFTLPAGWLDELEGAVNGEAKCLLTTYEGGEPRGARELSFNARVPERYAPVIESFSVRRYAQAVDDGGQTIYVDSLSGARVRVSLAAHIDRDGGLNPGTAAIRCYPAGNEEAATTVSVPWSGDSLTIENDRALIAREIPLGESWVFELTVTNGHSGQTAVARVEKSWAPLHVAGSGYGVGVGMYSDGAQAAPKFQVGWPAFMGGGIEGVSNFSTAETPTGGRWIDGSPLYARTLVVPITTAGSDTPADIGDGVGTILDFSGVLVTDGGSQRPIHWYHSPALYCDVYRYQSLSSIAVRAGETGTAYVTILYTRAGS